MITKLLSAIFAPTNDALHRDLQRYVDTEFYPADREAAMTRLLKDERFR